MQLAIGYDSYTVSPNDNMKRTNPLQKAKYYKVFGHLSEYCTLLIVNSTVDCSIRVNSVYSTLCNNCSCHKGLICSSI